MATPTDPLFTSQWHFNLIGDIETIWDEYTGTGVTVGIYDDGVQYTHPDLDGNYNSSLEVVNGSGVTVDPFPNLISNDPHGTSVAGLIGAENDGVGTVGVAYDALLTGVNVFDAATYGYINGTSIAGFLDVVDQASQFDIMSNSWGGTPLYQTDQNQSGSGFDAQYLQEIEQNLIEGRGGLGTVVVQAAGNDGIDANGSGVNSSRYTITVAATDINGNAADFTNVGSSILITAPAASYTTDLIGNFGYNATGTGEATGPDSLFDTNYTSVFGGTSAATPVVSGVIALMLQANDGLGWRDVQNILAISASHTGSAFGSGATGFEQGAWEVNGASNWNGGGMTVNGSYGYGMLDAFAAVRMAEVWDILYDTPLTSTNEQTGTSVTTDLGPTGLDIPTDGSSVSFTITSTVDISIEHIQLNLNFEHEYIGDVEIYLTDPDGNTVQIVFDSGVPTSFNGTWSYGIDSFLGTLSAGTWTVTVVDTFPSADDGTLYSGELEFFGSTITTDDVHHITADFLTYATVDTTRAVISDTNGGDDWLNFSSVGEAVVISLLAGGQFTVGGIVWGSLGTGVDAFENIITSDGDDSITGNSLDNEMHAMRGNDTLSGDTGDDRLFGGVGNDTLFGGADSDTLFGGEGNDKLLGGTGSDTADYSDVVTDITVTSTSATGVDIGTDTLSKIENILGGAGNDTITGGGVANSLVGNDGNDTLDGGAGNDTLFGGAGIDTLIGGAGDDALFGGSGTNTADYSADTMGVTVTSTLATGVDIGTDTLSKITNVLGGSGNDSITGGTSKNVLRGNDGNDTLDGGGGNDKLFGGAGNDTLHGGAGNDALIGGTGTDTADYSDDTMGITVTSNSATGVDIGTDTLTKVTNILGGSGNDDITGGAAKNSLSGNDGDDTLDGGGGNDKLFGGAGNDTLHGGSGNDALIGGTGRDTADYSDDTQGITATATSVTGAGVGTDRLAQIENIIGGSGNDMITGGNSANILFGNAGADTILGGGGADTIFGGSGDDFLTGDGGADTFVFVAGDGDDHITDFTSSTDKIDLSAYGFADFDALLAVINDIVGGTEITLSATDSIILDGVLEANLIEADFIL